MKLWRILALLQLPLVIASGWAVYDTTIRLGNCLNANRLLSEAFVTADAELQAVVDKTDGTLYIRVNGEHIHTFPNACGTRL